MKSILIWACFYSFFPAAQLLSADAFLVKNGEPRAEIVIAKNSPRSTRLAARELQKYLEKISGANLAIVSEPGKDLAVKLYVGQSVYTEKLGIIPKGLDKGAYRIASGDKWMALVGGDTNFVPVEPWPRNNHDVVSGKVQAQWEKITGAKWGNPLSQIYKHYTGNAALFGTPKEQRVNQNGQINVWGYDERGSFNAVCGFLRHLGVRWYMPGEIGEILPSMKSVPLPEINEIIKPDFPVRAFNFRFGVHNRDIAEWAMHLGLREPFGLQVAHGMHTMTHREEILKDHPDWFALYGGKRQNQPGQRLNHLCYSNEELFRETVRYVRAQFDHYGFDMVSVMPADGYTSICQCPLCVGKDSPERPNRGLASDYIWGFVNRVAKEVGKTNPDKKVICDAYGIYTLPPRNINKLEPNVQVMIVGGRRPTNNLPEQQEELRKLREDWVAKTDNPIMIFENYPFTDRGWYLPSYVPHALGESINATKGISRGESIWLSIRQDFDKVAIGYNHFPVYFTARMYWGGREQDVDAMFDEYCHLFYGPAGNAMKAFFEDCEKNWQDMEKDKTKVDAALEKFAIARKQVAPDSVYARRIGLVDDYLEGLRNKSRQLSQKRGLVPKLRIVGSRKAADIVIDGKLGEPSWVECNSSATGRLRELQTGRQPIFGTTVKTLWGDEGNVYFAIRCEENPGEKPNIATTKKGDQALWYGDAVEILIETESHSYYQIAVNPAGAIIDLDRGSPRKTWFAWDSRAEVATQVANDHWNVEIRIPVVQDGNDPLHQMIGHKPTKSLPWHVNICRQRVRDNGREYSAFSPTGQASFHEEMKFAHYYCGLSYQFPFSELKGDYLDDSRAATALMKSRRFEEARAAFTHIAGREGLSDFQRSASLEQASSCARSLKDFDGAAKLADQIPLKTPGKTVRMENLLAQRQWAELISQFGDEDFTKWPFWQIGAGAFARGRAYALQKSGEKAEADLREALRYTSDSRTRTSILVTMGSNRETNLKDDGAALEAYRKNFESRQNIGSAEEFRSVQRAAGILTRQGKFDEALATLGRIKVGQLRGYWHGAILLSLGETQERAGQKSEALASYRSILADKTSEVGLREKARAAIELLGKK